jgi:hypothetical protein
MTRVTPESVLLPSALSCLPVFLISLFLMGCGESPPPPVKKAPSLESQDPKERSDAARKAADDYGAK